ncbi:MAG: tetratricopeptide repeat protein [Flavobacteriales bacterium]|nr:tetratricopeptide repeat protein [Flavobacteriales bacterium]
MLRTAFVLLAAICLGLPGLRAQDADRYIAEGDSLLLADRPQKALDSYDAAIRVRPNAASYAARARAWYALDRMDRYLLDAEKALQLDTTCVEANYQRALYAYRGEDWSHAERLATRGLDHGAYGGLRQKLLILRGEARAELKRHEASIKDLTEGLGNTNSDPEAMRTLARQYDAVGDHASALTVLETLCTIEPANIGHWSNRGFELAALGRYDESLAMCDKALELDKDEPVALSNRAYALLKLGREKEAMQDVERSLRSYPANPYALRTRALLHLRKGERSKACADLGLARIMGDVPEVEAMLLEHCGGTAPQR